MLEVLVFGQRCRFCQEILKRFEFWGNVRPVRVFEAWDGF